MPKAREQSSAPRAPDPLPAKLIPMPRKLFCPAQLTPPGMVHDEAALVYADGGPSQQHGSLHALMWLHQCQGFVFNQDLFASPYRRRCAYLLKPETVHAHRVAKPHRKRCASSRRRRGDGASPGKPTDASRCAVTKPLSAKRETTTTVVSQKWPVAEIRVVDIHTCKE